MPGMLSRVISALHRWAESGWAGAATASWEVLQGSVMPGPSGAVFAPLAVAENESKDSFLTRAREEVINLAGANAAAN